MTFLKAIRLLILCSTVTPLASKYPSYFYMEHRAMHPHHQQQPPTTLPACIDLYRETSHTTLHLISSKLSCFRRAACSCTNTPVPPTLLLSISDHGPLVYLGGMIRWMLLLCSKLEILESIKSYFFVQESTKKQNLIKMHWINSLHFITLFHRNVLLQCWCIDVYFILKCAICIIVSGVFVLRSYCQPRDSRHMPFMGALGCEVALSVVLIAVCPVLKRDLSCHVWLLWQIFATTFFI